jgi:5-hydroxyisourate hydrolase-like protein (transthyretin family)
VVEEGGKKSRSPVEDVTVYLLAFKNSVWTTIATTNTDTKGFFEFGNLAAGKYMTIVDAPGLKMLNSIHLDLAASDTINIVFTITDEGIETKISTVGIEPITNDELRITVYPNPTTGELKIENGELKINNVEIFDIFGRNVGMYRIRPENEEVVLNISHLPAGVYFVRIQTEAGEVMRKVLKE